MFLIAGHHVGRTDEGANGAEPRRASVAGVTLDPVGRHGFRTAQPASTVRHDRRAFKTTVSVRGFAMVSSADDRHLIVVVWRIRDAQPYNSSH